MEQFKLLQDLRDQFKEVQKGDPLRTMRTPEDLLNQIFTVYLYEYNGTHKIEYSDFFKRWQVDKKKHGIVFEGSYHECCEFIWMDDIPF